MSMRSSHNTHKSLKGFINFHVVATNWDAGFLTVRYFLFIYNWAWMPHLWNMSLCQTIVRQHPLAHAHLCNLCPVFPVRAHEFNTKLPPSVNTWSTYQWNTTDCSSALKVCIQNLWLSLNPVPRNRSVKWYIVCVMGPLEPLKYTSPFHSQGDGWSSGWACETDFLDKRYTNIIRPLLNQFDLQPAFLPLFGLHNVLKVWEITYCKWFHVRVRTWSRGWVQVG